MTLILLIPFIFKEWSCDATTGLRTFVENERKKSNGNVCCRSSLSVRSEDDDYEYETDEYETDDKDNIDYDRESKKTYCSQRSGYRYTNRALSIYIKVIIFNINRILKHIIIICLLQMRLSRLMHQ